MSNYTPDPEIVRQLAAEVVLDAAREIDYGGIAEAHFEDVAFAGLDDDDQDTLQRAIHDAAMTAIVTVTWHGCDDEWSTEDEDEGGA